MSTPAVTIHVALLDEGVECWRPVPAREVAPGVYRIDADTPVPDDETWAFQPGDTVLGEQRTLSEGPALVAVRRAP